MTRDAKLYYLEHKDRKLLAVQIESTKQPMMHREITIFDISRTIGLYSYASLLRIKGIQSEINELSQVQYKKELSN